MLTSSTVPCSCQEFDPRTVRQDYLFPTERRFNLFHMLNDLRPFEELPHLFECLCRCLLKVGRIYDLLSVHQHSGNGSALQ